LHKQEAEYNERVNQLRARSEDQSIGVVQRNKAANELAQVLSEDPLPLRRAKLTTEAARKKAEKAKIVAEEAQRVAEEAATQAEQARRKAVQTAQQAELSKQEAERKAEEARERANEAENAFNEAQAYLEDLKSRPGGGQGALWWMERELAEARKFLPKRRQ